MYFSLVFHDIFFKHLCRRQVEGVIECFTLVDIAGKLTEQIYQRLMLELHVFRTLTNNVLELNFAYGATDFCRHRFRTAGKTCQHLRTKRFQFTVVLCDICQLLRERG